MVLRVERTGGTLCRLVEDDAPLVDANRFLEALDARGLSSYTIRSYAFDLLTLYRWLGHVGKQLTDLLESDLIAFILHQRRAGTRPRSINRRLGTSRLFYRFVTGKDLESNAGTIPIAPFYRGRTRDRVLGLHLLSRSRPQLRVKVPQEIVEPLSADQVRAFLRSLKRYRDLAIVYLMLLCGLRSKEVLDIDVHDVDFTEGQLRIHGKGNKERLLPLPDVLLSTLSDYLRVERPRRSRQSHLFLVLQGRRRGERMTADGLRSLFRHRRLRPEIANANAHRFRHTFGADMARAGVRLPVLQKMMGHALGTTTIQYIHLSMSDIADEYRRASEEIRKRYQAT
jgi:site-specific recombinase XerD